MVRGVNFKFKIALCKRFAWTCLSRLFCMWVRGLLISLLKLLVWVSALESLKKMGARALHLKEPVDSANLEVCLLILESSHAGGVASAFSITSSPFDICFNLNHF